MLAPRGLGVLRRGRGQRMSSHSGSSRHGALLQKAIHRAAIQAAGTSGCHVRESRVTTLADRGRGVGGTRFRSHRFDRCAASHRLPRCRPEQRRVRKAFAIAMPITPTPTVAVAMTPHEDCRSPVPSISKRIDKSQTIRKPSGVRSGSHQNASRAKRLNRSGGSNVSRGSAFTWPRTVCRPGVPARSSNSRTS